ncbi:unnamed protein product [Rhizophagus irregularis]|nr:unnamed protein product [Rhizophagus irregularis]
MLINVDLSVTAFYESGPLTQMIAKILGFRSTDDLRRGFSEEVTVSNIDVGSYFQNQYNRRLLYPFLPCVVVRRNQYLPIEVCDVIPEQRYMRKLNRRQTDDMMNFARQNPNTRQQNFKMVSIY